MKPGPTRSNAEKPETPANVLRMHAVEIFLT